MTLVQGLLIVYGTGIVTMGTWLEWVDTDSFVEWLLLTVVWPYVLVMMWIAMSKGKRWRVPYDEEDE